MTYMGSKAKYCKYLVPIIQKFIDENNITTYVEPFVGGANMIDKIKCQRRLGFDRSETLIALLCQMRDDFSALPTDGSRAMWDEGKAYVKDGKKIGNMTLAEIGAIEFFGSFSNGGFPRGYAKDKDNRHYYQEAWRNAENQAPLLKGIEFQTVDYTTINPDDYQGCLFYCDPPYKDTKFYGYSSEPRMDYDFFWQWVRELSRNNIVLVSEQVAPDDFDIVWEMEVKRTAGKTNDFKATEKLFRWKGE